MMLGAVPVVAGGLPGAIPRVAPVGVVGDPLAALPGVTGQLSGFPFGLPAELRPSANRFQVRVKPGRVQQARAVFGVQLAEQGEQVVLVAGHPGRPSLPVIRRRDYEAVKLALWLSLRAVRLSSELSGSRPGTAIPPPASTIGMGGGIIDREGRTYPEMPERDEQEDLRMLAEDPWAAGTEIDSGWTEDTGDE
jgi:hypothetical protein